MNSPRSAADTPSKELGPGVKLDAYTLTEREPTLGFGEVWHAHDADHHFVWLEVFEPLDGAAKVLEPFLGLIKAQKEFQTARHDNHVVAVTDWKSLGSRYAVVLQRTREATWREVWHERQRIDVDQLEELFEDVCHGIDEVARWNKGPLVHGGFTSASVVRWVQGERRRWRVMDFGLARVAKAREPDFVADYRAPEVVHHPDRANTQSEVFALGVFLAELLSGKTRPRDGVPWHVVAGEGPERIIEALDICLREEVTREVTKVVAQALQLDPDKRPEGPLALLNTLRPALADWRIRMRAAKAPSRPPGVDVEGGADAPPHLYRDPLPAKSAGKTGVAPQGDMPIREPLPPLSKLQEDAAIANAPTKAKITEPTEVPSAARVATNGAPSPAAAPSVAPAARAVGRPLGGVAHPPAPLPLPLPIPAPSIVARPAAQPHVAVSAAPSPSVEVDPNAWEARTDTYELPTTRYKNLQKLRKGAAEHLAWDDRTATSVVLTILSPRQVQELQRFYGPVLRAGTQELFSGPAADHVVRVLDMVLDIQDAFMVTELLRGDTLEERVRSHGPLEPPEALRHLEALCKVLTELARRNEAHGDLRPTNLRLASVGGYDILKVDRVGLAHPETSPVISPEQWDRSQATPRSDIWALGLVAYYMLSGEFFWRATDDRQQLRQQLFEDVPLASQRGKVPPGFDAWFAGCVHVNPHRRFRSADEALKELRRCLGTVTSRPPPVHSSAPPRRGSERVAPSHEHQTVSTNLATVRSIAVTDDRKWLMAGGISTRAEGIRRSSIEAWHLDTFQPLELTHQAHTDTVLKVASAGPYFATASADEHACCWDLHSSDFRRLTHTRPRVPLHAVAIAREPHLLVVAGGPGGTPGVWKLGSPNNLLLPLAADLGHRGAILDIAITRDSAVAITAGDDHQVALWDVHGGRHIAVLTGHTGAVQCLAVRPDGREALSGGRDGCVRVWSLDRRKCEMELTGHEGDVTCVAFIPGRPEALSAGADGSIRRWNLSTGACMDLYEGHLFRDGSRAAVWTLACLDEQRFASGGSDGTIRIWPLLEDVA